MPSKSPLSDLIKDGWDLGGTVSGGLAMLIGAWKWLQMSSPEQKGAVATVLLGAFVMCVTFLRRAVALQRELHGEPALEFVRGAETHQSYLYRIQTADYEARVHRVGLMNTGRAECTARTVFEASSCPIDGLLFGEPLRVKGSVAIGEGAFPESVVVYPGDTPSQHVDVLTEHASPDGFVGGPLHVSYTKHGYFRLSNAPDAFSLQLRVDGAPRPARIVLDCHRLPKGGLFSVAASDQAPVVPKDSPYCLKTPVAPLVPHQT